MSSKEEAGASYKFGIVGRIARDPYVLHVKSRLASGEAIDHPVSTPQEWGAEMLLHVQEKFGSLPPDVVDTGLKLADVILEKSVKGDYGEA